MSKNSTALALIAGVAIGTAVGILLAPDKGAETRRKIKKGIDDASQNIKDRIKSVQEQLSQFGDETASEMFSDLGDKSEAVLSMLEDKLASLKAEAAKMKK